MRNRREFLAASGVGLATLAAGWGPSSTDSTWLNYAPNAEQYWGNLPFLERLKKIGEAGFTHYEFGRWKTKDVDAIAKKHEELGLHATLFLGYPGLRGAKWKEGLLDAATDSAALGPKLGAPRAGVVALDRDEAIDRQDQIEDLVDALKEAVEKVAESEVVLILEPTRAIPRKPAPLVGTVEEAAAVVKAVGSDRLRFAFPIDPAAVVAGKVPDQIRATKDQAGYYRLLDFGPLEEAANGYALVLKAIHDVGHADPIGLGLVSKGDPIAAIEALRKLDAAAKGL